MKLETALRTIVAPSDAAIDAALVFCGPAALVCAASRLMLESKAFRSNLVVNDEVADEDAKEEASSFCVIDVFHRGRVRCIFVASGSFHGPQPQHIAGGGSPQRDAGADTYFFSDTPSSVFAPLSASGDSQVLPSLSCCIVAGFAQCSFEKVVVKELAVSATAPSLSSESGACSTAGAAAADAEDLNSYFPDLVSPEIIETMTLSVNPLMPSQSNHLDLSVMPLPASFLLTQQQKKKHQQPREAPSAVVDLLSGAIFACTRNASHSASSAAANGRGTDNNNTRPNNLSVQQRCRNRPGRTEELVRRTLGASLALAIGIETAASVSASSSSSFSGGGGVGGSRAMAAEAGVEKAWSEWTVKKLHDAAGKNHVLESFKSVLVAPDVDVGSVVVVPKAATDISAAAAEPQQQNSLSSASVSAISESLASLQASTTSSVWERSLRQASVAYERKQQLLLRQQQQQRTRRGSDAAVNGNPTAGGASSSLRRTASGENLLVADEGQQQQTSYETDQILKALTEKRASMSLARRAEEWMARMSAEAVPAPLRSFAMSLPYGWRFWLTPMGFVVIGTGLLMLFGIVLLFMS